MHAMEARTMMQHHLPSAPGLLARVILAVAAVLLLTAGCRAPEFAEVGEPVPAYAAATLDGESVSLKALEGEVVLVNVWATWCQACRRGMPALNALERDFGDQGFRVVSVSIDAAGDGPAIRALANELGMKQMVLHDPDQRVARTFRTRGVPESFLIGRDGTVLHHWIGRVDLRTGAGRPEVLDALARGRPYPTAR
jgi:cytochrome c biogenesis protein CcmG, thiol:disulfide interchange protein DsbE